MRRKKIVFTFLTVLIIFSALLFVFIRPYYIFAQKVLGVSPISLLLGSGNFKKTDNKVNILLLGKAGGQYDGPDLTDSITLISFNLTTDTVNLVSIPRDIWSDTLKDRINSAYAYGEGKRKGGGFLLSKAEISPIVGVPVHYAYLIDFEKFKEIIDFLGGVDVNVERKFDDYQFPVPGRENDLCGKSPAEATDEADYDCRYEHVSFKKGWKHMNGELALKFVRSRHANGEEGSDYARAQRQQKIISALFDKMLNNFKKFNLSEFEKTYTLVDKLVDRDIQNKDAAAIAKKFFFAKNRKINHISLSRDFFGVPNSINYEGKYVLIPEAGQYDLIHKYLGCYFDAGANCESIKPSPKQ